ncbi:flagellar biosynthesis anti-sigma factor FlgM [Methylophaga sp. 42_25_T18]|nr:flagellar biosynthesis anti-sigma factor FlgM [Methylophaga sp. 42_25_T18]OUR85938.1 flagellar biosynthesis anti-sigma factor FlgM [Methylophaga sp. 42_8_T64]
MSEINNLKATGQAELNSTRNVTARDNRDGAKSQAVPGSEARSDTVSLTNTATQLQSLQHTLLDVSVVNTEKVEALRAAIADGSYGIDVNELAQNLIDFEQQLN